MTNLHYANLHEAARNGKLDDVRTLLSDGADINAKDAAGDTPLYLAADAGHAPVVRLLLAHGADPNLKVERGGSPLEIATYEGRSTECVQLLLDQGASFDPSVILHLASAYSRDRDKVDIVRIFLDRGCDVNAVDPRPNSTGETPLYDAVASNYRESVKLLLERGADANAKIDGYLQTPLHQAALSGEPKIAELLLQAGADPNALDHEGSTPLKFAVARLNSTARKLNDESLPADFRALAAEHMADVQQAIDLLKSHGAELTSPASGFVDRITKSPKPPSRG